ncbi:MAG: hypothetical protein ACM3JJ_12405 [Hyphomicrobiales bacterium]
MTGARARSRDLSRAFALAPALLALAVLAALVPPGVAHAQPVPGETPPPPLAAPADSTAADSLAAPGDTTNATPLQGVTLPARAMEQPTAPDTLTVPRRERRNPLDIDRFELGVATVKGPFDALLTFGYHRFVMSGGPFDQWVHVEVSYGKAGYLKEGALNADYLFRPKATYKESWRIRPIVEGGPGFHMVFQVADIVGFSDSAFHTHAYLKTHGILGVEGLITRRWGVVVRGRISVPAHRPLDYAQAAIFLR